MSKSQSFSVSGFTVCPIRYGANSTHYLYARQHESSKQKESDAVSAFPSDRTLFLVNVPVDATERELLLFFKTCGTVERVVFDSTGDEAYNADASETEGSSDEDEDRDSDDIEQRNPRKKRRISEERSRRPVVTPLPGNTLRQLRKTGQNAHLVFLDNSSLSRALSLGPKLRPWTQEHDKDSSPMGLAHYSALYSSLRPPLDIIRSHADTSIELYEYELAKTKQKSRYKKGEAIVDDDGFTLVTRGGAYGKTLGGGVGVASKRFQAGRSGKSGRSRGNKKDAQAQDGFYAFQKAEKQRKELMDLKKNWEADKAKVEKLKASRRFNPY